MASPSLRNKIEQQRRMAPHELPKARACGGVVLSLLGGESDFDEAIRTLKVECGSNWSVVTAFQYMSGRQARLAAECALEVERTHLVKAHRIAEAVANTVSITRAELAVLRATAVTAAAELHKSGGPDRLGGKRG